MAKLMKHCIQNLVKWVEIPIPIWPSQPQLHMNTSSNIQPQERRIFWATITLINSLSIPFRIKSTAGSQKSLKTPFIALISKRIALQKVYSI